ncbi:hypothetical protein Pint_31565 [Pistacia integerrima]|uniref:Uncharacterized protein n=1 Tax=Pistacia integerrima TaxID=434235 RepID=A0ACC0XQB4_9ROSI|nr:hypothetical protein Pint_31565 [Pistacia integerrima]
MGDGIKINSCQLAFGAYGTRHAIRARTVEDFLIGKVLNFSVLYEAIKLLEAFVVPGRCAQVDGYSNTLLLKALKMKQNDDQFDQTKFPTLLSSAKQVLELSRKYYPVGEPIIKSGAALQASGEAVYVDDIPSPANCLYGAFVCSTKPLARIKGIEFKSKSATHGVSALISYKEIPEGGANVGSKTIFGAEPLFADELTRYAGQRVAFVVADTQKNADRAANLAVVDYDMENLEPPILSVEEAVERSSFF